MCRRVWNGRVFVLSNPLAAARLVHFNTDVRASNHLAWESFFCHVFSSPNKFKDLLSIAKCYEMFSPLIYISSADQNLAKCVSEWSVHRGNRAIVLAHDASAGGPLRFMAVAAVAEVHVLAHAVRTYCCTV